MWLEWAPLMYCKQAALAHALSQQRCPGCVLAAHCWAVGACVLTQAFSGRSSSSERACKYDCSARAVALPCLGGGGGGAMWAKPGSPPLWVHRQWPQRGFLQSHLWQRELRKLCTCRDTLGQWGSLAVPGSPLCPLRQSCPCGMEETPWSPRQIGAGFQHCELPSDGEMQHARAVPAAQRKCCLGTAHWAHSSHSKWDARKLYNKCCNIAVCPQYMLHARVETILYWPDTFSSDNRSQGTALPDVGEERAEKICTCCLCAVAVLACFFPPKSNVAWQGGDGICHRCYC